MATINANPYGGQLSTPIVPAGADKGYGGRIISCTATVTYAAQASGTVIRLFKANPGWLWMGGFILTNTTTGSATISIGNATQSALYSALAAYTTVDKPQWFMNNISASTPWLTDPVTPYTASEEILATTAAASLPASGILLVVGNFMIS